MGEANEGLREADCWPSLRGTGNRLGVVGASIGIDVVGDVLRRFAAESAIENCEIYFCPSIVFLIVYSPFVVRWELEINVNMDVVVVVVAGV